MTIAAPSYPAVLTRKNWDSNKGLLAKMAGFTGMGIALAALDTQYKKVKWTEYDMELKFPRGDGAMTLPLLRKAMEAAVADVKSGGCGKLRIEAFKVRDLADKTEKEFKANKLIPKSSTALCASIKTAADQLGVSANANSMGGQIAASGKVVTSMFDATAANIEKNFHTHLSKLETAFMTVARDPTFAAWRDAGIMTLARNLNQQVGNVSTLAAKGYEVGMDVATCAAFFKDMNLFARVNVPFEADADEPERKKHAKEMIGLLIRAKTLK